MTIRRFFRTPKGLLIIVLAVLAALAAPGQGLALVARAVIAAVAVAMLIDVTILRLQKGKWFFPSGALLTGLIIAMILSPREPWYVAAATSAIAVVSKYVFRVRTANVFNPAALALVATFYLFDTAQNWWGALGELAPAALVVLIAAGAFITVRVNRIPLVLAFLGSYYLLSTIAAFMGDPGRVAELYRAPDLHAALYFAFFMVTDPPTSPPGHRDQLLYGPIVAVASFATFELIGAAWFLLGGVLVANAWEAWRRLRFVQRNHGLRGPLSDAGQSNDVRSE